MRPTAASISMPSRWSPTGVNSLRGPGIGILLITHYQRLLNFIVPDYVHVMVQGRIVRSGGKELALELEEKGYDWMKDEVHEAGRRLATL